MAATVSPDGGVVSISKGPTCSVADQFPALSRVRRWKYQLGSGPFPGHASELLSAKSGFGERKAIFPQCLRVWDISLRKKREGVSTVAPFPPDTGPCVCAVCGARRCCARVLRQRPRLGTR